jgi:hypothetical protein
MQKNKKKLIVFNVSILFTVFVLIAIFDIVKVSADQPPWDETNVTGWSWSGIGTENETSGLAEFSHIGWFSNNCYNYFSTGMVSNCEKDYGVKIDPVTGNLSGYSWNGMLDDSGAVTGVGWLEFDPQPFPAPPYYEARVEPMGSTYEGQISGWARINSIKEAGESLGYEDWGWVLLGPEPTTNRQFGVEIDFSTNEISGFAWAGGHLTDGQLPPNTYENVTTGLGWIDFGPEFPSGTPLASYNDVLDELEGFAWLGNSDSSQPSSLMFNYGTSSNFSLNNTYYIDTAKVSTDKFVLCYSDSTDSNKGKAVVGSVTGTNITWGSVSEFHTGNTGYISCTQMDDDKFVVSYQDVDDGWHGKARVGTITDLDIAWGSESTFTNDNIGASISSVELATDKYVVKWGTISSGKAVVGQAADTTLSWGSISQFSNNGTSNISVDKIADDKFVTTFKDGSDDKGKAIIGSSSGLTIEPWGSIAEFNSGATFDTSVVGLETDKFVVSFRDVADGGKGKSRIGIVSGTTIDSWGSVETFESSVTSFISSDKIDNTHFAVSYNDGGDSKGKSTYFSVSGTDINSGNPEEIDLFPSFLSSTLISPYKIVTGYFKIGSGGYAAIGEPFTQTNIGWIGLNCKTAGAAQSDICASTDFQVKANHITGEMSGYAWIGESLDGNPVGWLDFDPNPFPASPNFSAKALLSSADEFGTYVLGDVVGWARLVSLKKEGAKGHFENWGWVKMHEHDSSNPYGVQIDIDTGIFSGFAWSGGGTVCVGTLCYDNTVGLGWISFDNWDMGTIPLPPTYIAPFLETEQGDIYSKVGVGDSEIFGLPTNEHLVPWGSEFYNSTFLIQSGGTIERYISELGETDPDYYIENYLDPLIPPQAKNRYTNVMGKLDVNGITSYDEEVASPTFRKNKFGTEVNHLGYNAFLEQHFAQLGINNLQGKAYHIEGDLTVDRALEIASGIEVNNIIASGTVVVDGDLFIERNITYEPIDASDTELEDIPSVVWIVKGSIYVRPNVTEIAGSFVAVGEEIGGVWVPGTGEFYSGAGDENLVVSGLVIAHELYLQRSGIGTAENIQASERIFYDGRIIINTPPGVGDFAKALPVVGEVAPIEINP